MDVRRSEDAGVVDVARDAVLELKQARSPGTRRRSTGTDGYDLDEHFSDAEDDN
jgi:hypothetical protein